MTQEEKMLLIKDLSSRLPYAVIVEHTSGFRGTLHDITIHHMYDNNDNVYDAICYTDFFGDEDDVYIEYFKPYLFPLSSITTKQRYELHDLIHNLNVLAINGEIGDWIVSSSEIDFYNKYYLDYRGLIQLGLAIDATGLNIY